MPTTTAYDLLIQEMTTNSDLIESVTVQATHIVRCVLCDRPVFDCPPEDADDAFCRDCGLDRLAQLES